jgi:DNA-binding PadR family transcriptional regulator
LGVRRRSGALLPLEVEILGVAVSRAARGEPDLHGFGVAKSLQGDEARRRLTAHGTLYKALARLEDSGLLVSRWEDAEVAVAEGRPRRRLYRITTAGQAAFSEASTSAGRTLRWNPT